MNVFTNEGYLKEQLRNARRLQWAGIASLALVFLVSCPLSLGWGLPPELVLVAYPFLFLGFPLFSMGNSRLKRLRKTPRPDQLITAEMKGLNNKYSLHHYATVGDKVIKHLLVAPGGLVVMESRDTLGRVVCSEGSKGDRWQVRTGILERLAGQNAPLGNPTQDLQASIAGAKELLAKIDKSSVEAKGLVVFTGSVDLEVEGCTYAAVPLDEVRLAVRDMIASMGGDRGERGDVTTMLTAEDRRKLNALIAPEKPPPPAKAAATQRSGGKP